MCATFTFNLDVAQLSELFDTLTLDESSPLDRVKRDAYPHTYALVITAPPQSSELLLTAKRYALTPAWASEEKVKWATYNARLTRTHAKTGQKEFIYDVPSWRSAFGKRHCLVPLNSFRESCHDGKARGHIAEFTPDNKAVLFAAGLYEDWVNKKTGEVLSTFAIITTEPDSFLTDIGHDRSPVFLNSHTALKWLQPFTTPQKAYDFLESHKEIPKLHYELVRKLKSAPASDAESSTL